MWVVTLLRTTVLIIQTNNPNKSSWRSQNEFKQRSLQNNHNSSQHQKNPNDS